MNFNKRLSYYLNETKSHDHRLDLVKSSIKGLYSIIDRKCLMLEDFLNLNASLGIYIPADFHTTRFYRSYIHPIRFILETIESDVRLPVILADNGADSNIPMLAKSRPINSQNISLLKLNEDRHWNKDVLHMATNDNTGFFEKKNCCVWRGDATGMWNRTSQTSPRHLLAKKFNFKTYGPYDFGLSSFVLSSGISIDQAEIESIKKFEKGRLSLNELLGYKFILVLEGNDVATCLKWVLSSNCVPIMPTPNIESWCMEGALVPWQHYIPIENNLEDLVDKINWGLDHPKQSIEISKNGAIFMKQFQEIECEDKLNLEIVRLHINAHQSQFNKYEFSKFNK